jgi:Glycosyl transferase family 2
LFGFFLLNVLLTIFVNLKNDRDFFKNLAKLAGIVKDENNLFDVFVPPLSDEILAVHRLLNLTNPGHYGAPVKLPTSLPLDILREVIKSEEEFKFREFVSRLIPLDRELPDMRKETCKRQVYSDNLPRASIILPFYNEPFSMIMRTIYSILKRSPPELIEEIILVDDCSDKGEREKEI